MFDIQYSDDYTLNIDRETTISLKKFILGPIVGMVVRNEGTGNIKVKFHRMDEKLYRQDGIILGNGDVLNIRGGQNAIIEWINFNPFKNNDDNKVKITYSFLVKTRINRRIDEPFEVSMK